MPRRYWPTNREPVPPRPLTVPPWQDDRQFAALMNRLDISALSGEVLGLAGWSIGPGRLAAVLSAGTERPDVVLRRMARRLSR